MEFEFMTAGTALPHCMPLPPVLLRLPTSSTAKVMYARKQGLHPAYGHTSPLRCCWQAAAAERAAGAYRAAGVSLRS